MLPVTEPTFYRAQRMLPHSAGAPAARSPVSRVPLRPGLALGCLPSASSRHPSPHPILLLSGYRPSPARRVPQLHGLHGAAGSRPDRLNAPSSRSPPRKPSHTSAFRPYRKQRAGLLSGAGHVVLWLAAIETRLRRDASRAASSGSGVSDTLSLACL